MVGLGPGPAIARSKIDRILGQALTRSRPRTPYQCVFCQHRTGAPRHFSVSSIRREAGHNGEKGPFRTRLRTALQRTKVQWYPIPVGLGIGFLGFVQLYRRQQEQKREKLRQEEEEAGGYGPEGDNDSKGGKPKKRKRIRPSGPWYIHSLQLYTLSSTMNILMTSGANMCTVRQVQVMSTLPLKAVSRIWGRFNELEIPYYLRVPGFKLYSWIFGVK